MIDVSIVSLEHGQRVRVSGTLDVRCAPDVRLAMHRLIESDRGPLYLDLADCYVRDSTAFGLLVELRRRAGRAHRPLRIVSADDRTRRLLRRARLGALLWDEAVPLHTATLVVAT